MKKQQRDGVEGRKSSEFEKLNEEEGLMGGTRLCLPE